MRIAVLGGIALTLLGLLLIRLWFLQVISGEQYAEAAEGNRLRTVVPTRRAARCSTATASCWWATAPGTNLVVQPARAHRRAPRAGARTAWSRPSSTA